MNVITGQFQKLDLRTWYEDEFSTTDLISFDFGGGQGVTY